MTDTPTPSIEEVKERLLRKAQIHPGLGSTMMARGPDGALKVERKVWDDGMRLVNSDGPAAHATITALQSELAKLKAEADEETAWDEAVKAAGGLDLFDALAGQWVAREPIRRMIRACTSVFAKWANDDLMSRYHEAVENIAREAYVEGAAAGALATLKDRPNTAKDG